MGPMGSVVWRISCLAMHEPSMRRATGRHLRETWFKTGSAASETHADSGANRPAESNFLTRSRASPCISRPQLLPARCSEAVGFLAGIFFGCSKV